MSKLNLNAPMVFWLIDKATPNAIAELKKCLYQCDADGRDLICMISGSGGDIYCPLDVSDTLNALKVNFITVGFGRVPNVMAAIFCLGNERVLMEGTILQINDYPEMNNMYMQKTLVSPEVFQEKVVNSSGRQWFVKSEEWERYAFITMPYSMIVDTIVNLYRGKGEVEKPFFLSQEFDCTLAKNFIKYIYECAANKEDVIAEIYSTGGNADCLTAIIDTLRCTKVRLITIASGYACSCAAILFLMGDVRCMKAGTYFLVHKIFLDIKNSTRCQDDELIARGESIRNINSTLEKMWLPNTTLSSQEYHQKVDGGKDWVVSPEECEKYGFITTEYSEVAKLISESRKSK